MTDYNYFHGIARAAFIKKTNDYGNYTVCLEFTDENEIAKYTKSGIQVEMKDNKVWFRRPAQKLIKGSLEELGPPEIKNAEGQIITDDIGDGSEVVVKVRSYPTMKGVGHTMDAVRVDKLVPYDGSGKAQGYNF